jgi:hypothetical protein
MSDSAFKSAPYSGYTSQELRAFISNGSVKAEAMLAEIKRRNEVASGDMSRATDGERLRVAMKLPNRKVVKVDDLEAQLACSHKWSGPQYSGFSRAAEYTCLKCNLSTVEPFSG